MLYFNQERRERWRKHTKTCLMVHPQLLDYIYSLPMEPSADTDTILRSTRHTDDNFEKEFINYMRHCHDISYTKHIYDRKCLC